VAAEPRRRGWRRSSGEHSHGVGAYRARLADTGGRGGLPGWRWSAAVVMEWLGASLRTAMATVELRELGGCCWRCETTKEERGKRNEGAGRCGRVLVC